MRLVSKPTLYTVKLGLLSSQNAWLLLKHFICLKTFLSLIYECGPVKATSIYMCVYMYVGIVSRSLKAGTDLFAVVSTPSSRRLGSD